MPRSVQLPRLTHLDPSNPMALFSIFEENYLLLLPIFFLPLLYFILKQLKSSATSKNSAPLPPGPTPWPILGNIHQIGKLPHVSLSKFAQKHGPLIKIHLGTQFVVVGSSREAATEILKTHDRILSARYVPKLFPSEYVNFEKNSMTWALTCDNGVWKPLRTLCRSELFSVKILDAQSKLRKNKISEMIQHLKAKEEGGVVNIGELVFASVFNMLSNVLLSKDLIGMSEKNADGRMKGLMRSLVGTIIAPNYSEYFPILSNFDFQKLGIKAMTLVAKIQSIWEPIIEERRKAGVPVSQNDFLDVLLHNNFNNDQIHQLILELFIAGTDTSAATIEWVMAELVKSPESMKKVRQEIDQQFGTNPVEESGLAGLPYLHACIRETLRLHPPVPLLLHRAHEECQVMNYRIPQNSKVMVNVWAIGRDPTIWDEPLKFKPERFSNSAVDFKGNDFELLPFSAGRRICPGLPMAGRHVPLVLAALNQSFDWCQPDGKEPHELDMSEKFGLIMQKEKPLLLIPKPRK